ncbi:protein-disulfide reductase DsbD [Undibacterium arcticum]|uniref:Thiol:disulfide interchange protein DsbD n=1 Tax=Undibacterium arcticum TaxID=1762892 RepID=A0ABV7F6R8_9BURK
MLKKLQRMFALLLVPGLLAIAPQAQAADDDYLEPEVAFVFSAKMEDPKTVAVSYAIADGYYMYRERFHFEAVGAKLGHAVMPTGKVKFDETFQKNVETYRHTITIKLPVEASGAFTLKATGQGCADKGLCYAPMTSEANLAPTGGGLMAAVAAAKGALAEGSAALQASPAASSPLATVATPTSATRQLPSSLQSEMGKIESSLKSGRFLLILPLFFLLGLGLSFTPCVLPMVPILSFIIVGEGTKVKRSRAFLLSATYALGMAIVYTALGVAAGLVGEGLSATLQNPWVLGAFALLMAALSLSMFGVYQLQVPSAVQTRLIRASENQVAGKLFGVFAMGAISALIVGPCVAAPLAGALVYISQTRDVVVGGGALFAMAVGMSVPLLLVGISAGALLPRAGAWMEAVKRFFGVLMLAMALWMVAPVLPAWAQMLAWAALGAGYGAYLLRANGGWVATAFGLAFAALGLVQLVGVASGGRDVSAPLAHLGGKAEPKIAFTRIKTVADLDAALAQASGKPAMLDFYADWCVSCKEMEKFTFSEPKVQAQLSQMLLLQVDVTANDAADKEMLKRFGLFGPPGIIFFDAQGREIRGARVIGYQNSERFLQSLGLLAQR